MTAVPEPTLEGKIAEAMFVALRDAEGMCWCGFDGDDLDDRSVSTHLAHVAAELVVEVRERAVEEALAEHRRDWAGWLDNWDGAVGPERPTIQAVVRWLRADTLPFGVAANPDAGGRP